jgi:hypothetical protein
MVDSQMLPMHAAHSAGVAVWYAEVARAVAPTQQRQSRAGGRLEQGRSDAAVGRRRGTALPRLECRVKLEAMAAVNRS